jgi:hypothetical protein
MPDINKMNPKTSRYLDENNDERNALDTITGSFKNTNSDHSAIHLGYGMCLYLEYASLAANTSKIYRFKGPTNLYAHIKSIQVGLEGATCRARLIRGATITNIGTEIPNSIHNLNDNSTTLPQSKVYDGTVAYTGGSIWCQTIVHGDTSGAGTATSLSSGSFIQNENIEYVTKDNDTNYILEITNLSLTDAATNVTVNMFFYEEPRGVI